MVLLLIIAIVILAINLSNKSKEVDRLKNELMGFPHFCAHCGNKIYSSIQSNFLVNNNVNMNINNVAVNSNVSGNKIYNEKDTKNILILTIGSIMVILSALILLITSWEVMHNVVKAIILFLMLFIFMGVWYLAKNKFKLTITSKVFLYLGMAYLPICLFSLSALKLLGLQFSLTGAKCILYYGIASFIVSIVYIIFSSFEKLNVLYVFSSLFIIVGIILLGVYCDLKFEIIIAIILLLQLIVELLKNKNIYIIDKRVTSILTSVYNISFFAINILSSLFDRVTLITFLPFILNMFYLIMKQLDNKKVFIKILSGIIAIYFGIFLYNMIDSILILQLVMYLYYFTLLFISCIDSKKGCFDSFLIISIFSVVISASLFVNSSMSAYIYTLIYTFICALVYIMEKKDGYLLTLFYSLIFTLIFFVVEHDYSVLLPLIFSIMSYFLFSMKDKNNNNKMLSINSLIVTTFLCLCLYNVNNVISGLLLFIFNGLVIYNFRNKNHIISFIYTIFIVLRIISLIVILKPFKYIFFFLLLVLSVIYNIVCKHRLYELLIYISTFCLANIIISDVNLGLMFIYILVNYIIVIMFIMNYFRNGVNLVLEYILYSLLILFSLFFKSTVDGLLIVTLLCLLLVFGYTKKSNSLLYCNGIGALLCSLIITKDFWISIPWWIYLLLIGCSLLIFGIYNENKKNK